MSLRPALAALAFAALALVAAGARAEECPRNAAGQSYATGTGSGSAKADTAGLRRVGAERAAFFDGLNKLRGCLGDKANKVTGWNVAEVRYFDSDPIVEVDVLAAFDAAAQVTILGSALPNLARSAAAGGNIKEARLSTTRAAVAMAQRNAKEALDAVFPSTDGAAGSVKKELAGSVGGCVTSDIAYFDDQAVSVKVTCGRSVTAPAKAAEPHPAPKAEKHP